jgi:hypothetical protein
MHRVSSWIAAGAALCLVGCGGGGSPSTLSGSAAGGSGSGGSGGTGNGGGTTEKPVYSMGNGTGSGFQSGAMGLSSTTLAAGGTASITINIVDQTGTLYASTTAVSVNFNSSCLSSGLAALSANGAQNVQAVSTTTGTVNATYTAKGCSGPDVITATAAVGGQSLTATGTVTVAAASVGSIQFVSATPATIGLKGTGLGETSTVVFKVVDSSGGPRAGASVTFSLNTNVGGLNLAPTTATSAADGTVQTVVSSGTAHTSVRVTAAIAQPALSTQSSVLSVTTGIPTSKAFSLAVGDSSKCYNVEAYNHDGVTVPITVRLADRFGNPAPDGTTVAFTTNGGHIGGSCSTPSSSSSPGDGTCSVNWVSANPRPSPSDPAPSTKAGRVTILATAIGEESFSDTNGNGYYDAGEPFDNLGEPFRDDNEDGVRGSTEYFLDFNHNSQWDAADGTFKGITCTGSDPSSTCSTSTLAIGVSGMMVMSTDGAQVIITSISPEFTNTGTAQNPVLTLAHGTTGTIGYTVQDLNGNTMAAGTTVATTATSGIGTASQLPASYKVPCNTGAGQSLSSSLAAPATLSSGPVSGNLIITVTSVGGLASTFGIPVTVN